MFESVLEALKVSGEPVKVQIKAVRVTVEVKIERVKLCVLRNITGQEKSACSRGHESACRCRGSGSGGLEIVVEARESS
jgi:hypothetical protein